MDKVIITDTFGDELVVSTDTTGHVYLDADSPGGNTELSFGPDQAKKLRKALKKYLRESKA